MNHLLRFNKNGMSQNEQLNVKGGIRFITNDRWEYKAKKQELKSQNISFMKEKIKDPITKVKTYCIEW